MATDKQRNPSDPPVSVPAIGKDEMNLCELPIAKLGRRDKREIIEFVGEVVKDGQTLTQEWIVRGAAGLGLPTEFAERVLVALISLAAAQGFQGEKTSFTVYEVLKLMGLGTDGHYYKEVTLALQRLHGVTITGKNTWWDNDKKKYRTISKGFGLIDNYWLESLADEDDDENESGMGGYVVWNEWLWESFQAGYIKNLNTRFYYALENTLARRLYRFLDKRMHYQDSYQIDIFALAARLGMAEYHYPSKVIEKLQPAFDELIAQNYLGRTEIIKVGKFTRVKFTKVGLVLALQKEVLFVPAATNTPEATKAEAASESSLAALYTSYETSDFLKEVWVGILQELKQSMPSASYLTIAKSVLLAVQDGSAVIAVPANMIDWAARQLRRKILTGLSISLKTKITGLSFCSLP
jgi:hypothetical protein